jgi:hypothetical protein
MLKTSALTILMLITSGCTQTTPLSTAEIFIDAFYSWDTERLARTFNASPEETAAVLYYQGWAEGGHYEIKKRRPCTFTDANQIQCRITFTLTMNANQITGVTFEGDDPPIFLELQAWMMTNRPEIFTGPCKDLFAGGTTPGQCARSVARAAQDFVGLRTASD